MCPFFSSAGEIRNVRWDHPGRFTPAEPTQIRRWGPKHCRQGCEGVWDGKGILTVKCALYGMLKPTHQPDACWMCWCMVETNAAPVNAWLNSLSMKHPCLWSILPQPLPSEKLQRLMYTKLRNMCVFPATFRIDTSGFYLKCSLRGVSQRRVCLCTRSCGWQTVRTRGFRVGTMCALIQDKGACNGWV